MWRPSINQNIFLNTQRPIIWYLTEIIMKMSCILVPIWDINMSKLNNIIPDPFISLIGPKLCKSGPFFSSVYKYMGSTYVSLVLCQTETDFFVGPQTCRTHLYPCKGPKTVRMKNFISKGSKIVIVTPHRNLEMSPWSTAGVCQKYWF